MLWGALACACGGGDAVLGDDIETVGLATTHATDDEADDAGSTGADPSPDDSTGAPAGLDDPGADGPGRVPTRDPGEDTGADPPRRPAPAFVDVTAISGLAVDPGPTVGAPACGLDDVSQPGPGDFCMPRRFLGAAAVADYDGDGDLDVYLTRKDGPDRLMRNDGHGRFAEATHTTGIRADGPSGAAAWLDLEGDGDLDLLVTTMGGHRHRLFVNDGTGRFDEQGEARGLGHPSHRPIVGMGIAVGDYDLDGWVDVFVAEWRPTKQLGRGVGHNRLLHNRGAAAPGTFEDVTVEQGIELTHVAPLVDAKAGEYGFAPAFVDLDGDDWPELTLTADFGTSRLYWNDAGDFTDATWEAGVGIERNGMGSTFGDIDGDGDLDWFVSAIYTPKFGGLGHRLYRYDGARHFAEVSVEYGVHGPGWGWGASLFDRDHDGDLDLAMAAGWPALGYDADPFVLWDDVGATPWVDRAAELGVVYPGEGRGVVTFDADDDGDLDLLVVGNAEPPALFRNDAAPGDWLEVTAQGVTSNRFGLGAVVRVQVVEGGPEQVRHIGVGSHLFGQAPAVAHFGLGEGEGEVARVTVHWPATGLTDTRLGVPRNATLQVIEGDRP